MARHKVSLAWIAVAVVAVVLISLGAEWYRMTSRVWQPVITFDVPPGFRIAKREGLHLPHSARVSRRMYILGTVGTTGLLWIESPHGTIVFGSEYLAGVSRQERAIEMGYWPLLKWQTLTGTFNQKGIRVWSYKVQSPQYAHGVLGFRASDPHDDVHLEVTANPKQDSSPEDRQAITTAMDQLIQSLRVN